MMTLEAFFFDCDECGEETHSEELVDIGGAWLCPDCAPAQDEDAQHERRQMGLSDL
jgi:formylmethanofuran dehydrogenase subunit E